MNVKDMMELIQMLSEERDQEIFSRNYWDDKCLEATDPEEKKSFSEMAAKAGVKAGRWIYFIRALEEMPILR